MTKSTDIYETITNKIIEKLEKVNSKDFKLPWNTDNFCFPKRHNGVFYQGINILILWCEAEEKGFNSPYWLTFKQALELNANVKKGEKSSQIVFYKTLTKEEENEEGKLEEKTIPMLKTYNVFNAEQIEGLPESYYIKPPKKEITERNPELEAFFDNLKADIQYFGNKALYRRTTDQIILPPIEFFENTASFYSTKAHELTHWTGSPERLARTKGQKFGDENYSKEELVAELGASFVCGKFGIIPQTIENHAQYIKGWLENLKSDKKFIFQASSQAQKAVDYMESLQQQELEKVA